MWIFTSEDFEKYPENPDPTIPTSAYEIFELSDNLVLNFLIIDQKCFCKGIGFDTIFYLIR